MDKRTCSVKGCDDEHVAKGFCNKHYRRYKNNGNPHISKWDRNMTPKQRILKNIKKVKCHNLDSLQKHKEKDLICWEWKKGKDKDRYGRVQINYKLQRTHRLSYREFVGKIPEGKLVLHKCDNPPCCNPNHLFLGTKKDNSDDMKNKNRGKWLIGEKHGISKLNKKQVIQIRKYWKTGKYTQMKLGKIFNISRPQISNIINNKVWKHIGVKHG